MMRVIIILLLFSLAACKPTTTHHFKIKTHPKSMEAPKKGYYAPNFAAYNPNNEKIFLENVMGKATIIDFWASWCRPCREAANPAYFKLYQKYHTNGLNIIAISSDRHLYYWHKALKQDSLPWVQVLDSTKRIFKMYDIKKIPSMFLIDKNGLIVGKNLWADKLELKIDSLVNLE